MESLCEWYGSILQQMIRSRMQALLRLSRWWVSALPAIRSPPGVETCYLVYDTCLGRRIPYYKVCESKTGPRVWIVGSLHGNETPGIHICNEFVKRQENWKPFLSDCTVYVLPNGNPDGFAHHTRNNANGVDLNRDFGSTMSQPETRGMEHFLDTHKIDFAIVFHSGELVVCYPPDRTYVHPIVEQVRERQRVDELQKKTAAAYVQWHGRTWQGGIVPYRVETASMHARFDHGTVMGKRWYECEGTLNDFLYTQYATPSLVVEASRAKDPLRANEMYAENATALVKCINRFVELYAS